jgi:hypothetical protein
MRSINKAIIAIFVCLLSMFANAESFISEAKCWSVLSIDAWLKAWSRTTVFKFDGDTLINEKRYSKLMSTEDETNQHWVLHALWRETIEGKIFSFNTNSKKENMVYDFSLQEKDTFVVLSYDTLILKSLVVDSIRVNSWGNVTRKVWFMHSPEYLNHTGTVWVEGIGSMGYFPVPTEAGVVGAFNRLLCYSEGGFVQYQNEAYGSCYIRTDAIELKQNHNLIACLSVRKGSIQIRNNIHLRGNFSLFTCQGKLIKKEYISELCTEVYAPDAGLYLYRFEAENGQVQTGKVLVK